MRSPRSGASCFVQLQSPIPERNLVIALNDILPPSVRVILSSGCCRIFTRDISAKAKTYRYRIYRAAICPPFWRTTLSDLIRRRGGAHAFLRACCWQA